LLYAALKWSRRTETPEEKPILAVYVKIEKGKVNGE
jgi:hypothetical protein